MATGFYKRRRGILEHLEAGRLSLLEVGIHDFLCLKAGAIVSNGSLFPPGVWFGSAAAIVACCPRDYVNRKQTSYERAVRRVLERLEAGGYIKTWKREQGERGNFPILISRYPVRDQSGNEYEVNAEGTTDWRKPALTPVRDLSVKRPCAVREASVIKEIRNKKQEKKNPQTAASPLFQAALEFSCGLFREERGEPPNWSSGDFALLRKLFERKPDLTLEEYRQQFLNFWCSADFYWGNVPGKSLRFFISHFDMYINGPINSKQEARHGNGTSKVDRSRENARRAADELEFARHSSDVVRDSGGGPSGGVN